MKEQTSNFFSQTIPTATLAFVIMASSDSSILGLNLFVAALVTPLAAHGSGLMSGPLQYPEVNADTWVLIEIWPVVNDITLSAYFMDASSRKNENLCLAAKRSLDRDAIAIAKEQKREATSYRQCLTIRDAVKAGYVETGE